MNRPAQRYPADSLSLVTFALLVATGAIMPLALTPRSHGTTLRRLERHDRGNIHFWMAVSILDLLSIHLPLHWKWTARRVRSHPRGSKRARPNEHVSASRSTWWALSCCRCLSSRRCSTPPSKGQGTGEKGMVPGLPLPGDTNSG
ncbi:MAG: DUF4405 domain-containing protein [Bacteroidetes bacterium]|nr:DUF4405 domain-containing protein [Bacteroidota bacterium]